MGVRSTFRVAERMMAVEVPQNEEISREKNRGEKESVLLSDEEERIGGALTLRKQGKVFSEMFNPT